MTEWVIDSARTGFCMLGFFFFFIPSDGKKEITKINYMGISGYSAKIFA